MPVCSQGTLVTPQFTIPMYLMFQSSIQLLSVDQLTDRDYHIGFDSSSCFVQDCQTRTIVETSRRRTYHQGLYILDHLHLPSTTSVA
uniref:Uncharacterized protein n=1 Tax=Arundo donax TaxID=35708 RepID=A0A0A9GBB5_ARUDO